ncbi:MAG TPA: hypothetical protein DCX06_09295 [Opitutae bacterium]|nr:hypothetical protein [Opitutae bacterium]
MKNLENNLAKRNDPQCPDEPVGIICASFREGAPALVIITLEGKRWVMPWVHFLYAWHETRQELEQISLQYNSHKVLIEGVRLESSIQQFSKFGVEWIRSYDKRYLPLCPKDSPFIEKILIEEKSE